MERVKGIEPSFQAWEAHVLPLNHTRVAKPHSLNNARQRWQFGFPHSLPRRPLFWENFRSKAAIQIDRRSNPATLGTGLCGRIEGIIPRTVDVECEGNLWLRHGFIHRRLKTIWNWKGAIISLPGAKNPPDGKYIGIPR
jgi:hypothetical protein